MEKAELYETFQKGLTSVAGECYLAKKADVAATLVKIFQEKDVKDVNAAPQRSRRSRRLEGSRHQDGHGSLPQKRSL